MWWRKSRAVEAADVEHARAQREEAVADLAQLQEQSRVVARMTSRLIERRALNHFGDDIQITFVRKERHAR